MRQRDSLATGWMPAVIPSVQVRVWEVQSFSYHLPAVSTQRVPFQSQVCAAQDDSGTMARLRQR